MVQDGGRSDGTKVAGQTPRQSVKGVPVRPEDSDRQEAVVDPLGRSWAEKEELVWNVSITFLSASRDPTLESAVARRA